MVLKELIFNSFYLRRRGGRTGNRFFILKGCGGLGKTDFNSFYFGRVWDLGELLKEHGCDFNSSNFGSVWWS